MFVGKRSSNLTLPDTSSRQIPRQLCGNPNVGDRDVFIKHTS